MGRTKGAAAAAQAAAPSMLSVETWPINRLVPYKKNARKIPQSAIDKVAASLREFGWRQPIVVDDADIIVMGHTRRLAALKLGMAEVPVHVARGLSETQIKALRIMDNRSADESSWDFAMLGFEMTELKGIAGFDLGTTGFDIKEIDTLLGGGVPETPAEGGKEDPSAENSPVISYTIVFNTEDEQRKWFDFLKKLRTVYPEATIAERIVWYVEKHLPMI